MSRLIRLKIAIQAGDQKFVINAHVRKKNIDTSKRNMEEILKDTDLIDLRWKI